LLNARNATIAGLAVAAFCILVTVLRCAGPPDSDGLGLDSYGTRRHGLRALYETLEGLRIPVRRGLAPTTASLSADSRVVIWAPDKGPVAIEPEYLRLVGEWVELGGAVVFAPSRADSTYAFNLRATPKDTGFVSDLSAIEALGLPEVELETVEVARNASPPRGTREARATRGEDDPGTRSAVSGIFGKRRDTPEAYSTIRVTADGTLGGLRAQVTALHVPAEGLRVLDPASRPAPMGRILYADGTGAEHVLAAVFRRGAGTITVVADPALFLNRSIARADNSVLAVGLLAGGGRTVVLDEFYHGLTIRGNPAWLLTRHPYGLVVVLLLLASLIWVWRARRALGPPVPPPGRSRRSVVEYVEAMARLFHRSGHNRFILNEVRKGVLWTLRGKSHLPHGVEDPGRIAAALERRDPEAAARFRKAIDGAAPLLQGRRGPAAGNMARSAKELCSCV